jgi:hypothetical protein
MRLMPVATDSIARAEMMFWETFKFNSMLFVFESTRMVRLGCDDKNSNDVRPWVCLFFLLRDFCILTNNF